MSGRAAFPQRRFSRRALCSIVVGIWTLFGTFESSAGTACEKLANIALPNAKIGATEIVAAGTFVPPGGQSGANTYAKLPAFCRVRATLTPTSDSDIKTEIWLPAAGWNGKFQAVGNGGWAGTIPYAAMAGALMSGFATAGSDTGHAGGNADFAIGHPEKVVDFAYRSVHEMTVQAKSLVASHYGSPARISYYSGCSQGGRQGLAAAQQYPEDFNGIIAGAPSWNQMRAHAARVALNLIVNKDSDSMIPPSKYPTIHEAVMNACDITDGVKDGVIENPKMCKYDYSELLCKTGDGPNCLTKGQVESAQAMVSPLKDPKTGKVLFEGHLMPGSELGWATLAGPQPLGLAVSGMQNVLFKDRKWDYHSMEISSDVDDAAAADNGVTYSGDPNLKPFFDHGGKLLMYHGWTDQQVNPVGSVIYYDSVLSTVGKDKAANSIALFMVPGMNHCRGGAGTDAFDMMAAMESWVEQGKKPGEVVAAHLTDGEVDKTRPLCPYPQVAKYKGTGSTNDAANFTCGK